MFGIHCSLFPHCLRICFVVVAYYLSFVLVLWCSFQHLILLCNHFAEEDRIDCFALIVFLFSVDGCPLSLPCGALWLTEAKSRANILPVNLYTPPPTSRSLVVVRSYCVAAPFISRCIWSWFYYTVIRAFSNLEMR